MQKIMHILFDSYIKSAFINAHIKFTHFNLHKNNIFIHIHRYIIINSHIKQAEAIENVINFRLLKENILPVIYTIFNKFLLKVILLS